VTRLKIISFALLLLGLFSVFCWPVVALAQGSAEEGRISLDFRDVELVELIKTISELTGKNFLYDETVKGKVTIISPETMTLDETYRLFLTVLNIKGYTLVPSGKVNKIIQIKNAKQENLPIFSERGIASDQFITRMVRLKHLDVEEIASSVLEPLMPTTGNIIAYPPTNMLIMTETAATIERLVRIVEQLDQPESAGELTIIKLKHAQAEEVVEICEEVLLEQASNKTKQSKVVSTSTASNSKIMAYSRTNSLIVLADKEDLARIKALLEVLDTEAGGEQAGIHVYYLENADAETLAKTLNQIIGGIQSQASSQSTNRGTGTTTQAMTAESVTITADAPTNALVINAPPNDYQVLQDIIHKLDIKRKQVYVEALILELSMEASEELGAALQGAIDTGDGYSYLSTNQNTSSSTSLTNFSTADDDGNLSVLSQAVSGVLLGGMFNTITTTINGNTVTIPALSALINLSKTDENINVLSAPRLLTMNNEEAEIVVGENVPVVTATVTDTDSENITTSVEREDAALTLRFTPQVIEDNLVRLTIYQEITGVVEGTDSNSYGPDLTKRLITNTVLAESRKTIVLGGLISSTVTDTETKVPFLGDIPILGWLFKSTSSSEDKSNLLVFITPTIINSPEDLAAVTDQNKRKANEFLTNDQRLLLSDDFKFVDGEVESDFFQIDMIEDE
jgi:general secretion pathway protein D